MPTHKLMYPIELQFHQHCDLGFMCLSSVQRNTSHLHQIPFFINHA